MISDSGNVKHPSSEASDDSSGNSSGDKNGAAIGLKTRKQGLEEAAERIADFYITKKREELAEKKPPGNVGLSRVKILTNVLGVRLSSVPVFLYDVEVSGINGRDKRVELTRGSPNDYTSIFCKSVCFEAFKKVQESNIFADKLVYYNGQKTLYAIDELKLTAPDYEHTFEVPVNGKRDLSADLVSIHFTVRAIATKFTLNDMTSLLGNMRTVDRTLLQFIEVATSQFALSNQSEFVTYDGGRIYLMDPLKHGFKPDECPNLPEGKHLSVGARKSAAVVEGPRGRGSCNAALVLDTSKTAFHRAETVLNKAISIFPELLDRPIDKCNLMRLREQLVGLFAEKRHNGHSCVFQITQVSEMCALDVKFQFEGSNVTIAEYFERRYSHKLRYPQVPLLVNKKARDKEIYFPMEICYILGNQRVKTRQQTAAQLKGMRRACNVEPAIRCESNKKNVLALRLTDPENKLLRNDVLEIIPKPLVAEARILYPPFISYGRAGDVEVSIDSLWQKGRREYLVPAKLRRWAAYMIADKRDRALERDFRTFIQYLVTTASSFGMDINFPADDTIIPSDKGVLEEVIRVARKEGCTFIFFVQHDASTLHDAIKHFERKYEIITQDLKFSTFVNIVKKNKHLTLENVINKLNVKIGGLNYAIYMPDERLRHILNDRRLIIGFSMAHPGAPSSKEFVKGVPSLLSVVGYASNSKGISCEFIGDFGFQDSRQTDNIFLVDTFVKRIVKQFLRNRSIPPREVFVYRSGVSEGQHNILDYEVPLIRKGLIDGGCDGNVKITFILVSRAHNFRFIPKELDPTARIPEQNCRPGTVLDKQVVHPRFNEFYLNSHKTIQGTAKTPRYTVIVDDSGISLDELEEMTYSLCYCHQIVNLSTSVPAPLYIATRYAERGRRLLMENKADNGSVASGRSGDSVNPRDVNMILPLYGTVLGETRVNA